MNLIVAADRNWGIGNKGDLLVRIPADHKMFRQETVGKVVVLGRKTMDTFPGGRPLKDRTNIVLTRNPSYQNGDAVIVHSVKELLETLKAYDSDDVYIIGGTSVYEQLLPYCDTVYVTKIDFAYQADTFFPNLDESSEWERAYEREEQTCFDIEFTFRRYERIR